MKLSLSTLLVGLMLFAGCSASEGERSGRVKLEEAFALKVGQRMEVVDEGVNVQLVQIVQDSRCPDGTQCIRAGEVTVELELSKEGKETAQLQLSGPPFGALEGSEERSPVAVWENYEITLQQVEPYPREGESIAKEDYEVTVKVSKSEQ